MATDEERREVARRLRENAEAHPDMSLILNVAFADDRLRPDGAMEWRVTPHDAAMRLADLIEPSARCPHYMYPCCRTDAGGDYIDRDALLALADEMGSKARKYVDRFDENSGTARALNDYARRIREACGEVPDEE